MKAKLLVSTAFLAASVSLSAQKSATITVHAKTRIFPILRDTAQMYSMH